MRKFIKNILPKSFLWRGVLIVVVPVILIQIVTAFLFFNRHWENVTRHRTQALAGEISFMAYLMASEADIRKETVMYLFRSHTDIQAAYKPSAKLKTVESTGDFPEFQEALRSQLVMPFNVRLHDDYIATSIQLSNGVLELRASAKRLESPTTMIFLAGMVGASSVFLCIALLFLRNQVRPMRQLAEAAERFGKGRDTEDFKPSGALEIRRAGRAFLIMRERIQRQIRTRTEMLASISHDLRTPLTRMKLQLAMFPKSDDVQEMEDDVSQMQEMIAEYLEFARSGAAEEAVEVLLADIMQDIINDYKRTGADIHYEQTGDISLEIKPNAYRRMLHNVLDNALKHGTKCNVSVRRLPGKAEITVEDNGPGIPEEKREEVFRPFTRLDPARNMNNGGVGLGLTIARDIIFKAGGTIGLDRSSLGGLRVTIRLPI